ncbi:MAG: DNA-3-methyladenine glycosylase 2 family protein [Acidobacteria bacterium]|nr:DNA-3-methyladenine glycosylase 2 family protein [Acidobacteriota bacterium]
MSGNPGFRIDPVPDPHVQAIAHLRGADPILARLIAHIGPCTLKPLRRHFFALTDAIISQQLSLKAAATILGRFKALYGRVPIPREVLETADTRLRRAGLSRQKVRYIKDLAAKFANGELNASSFRKLDDEEIIRRLTCVKGIGRWTAEMFLIFALNRPDVLPVDDLGFRKALQQAYGLRGLPSGWRIRKLAEPWRPYRTYATWYLWAARDRPAPT